VELSGEGLGGVHSARPVRHTVRARDIFEVGPGNAPQEQRVAGQEDVADAERRQFGGVARRVDGLDGGVTDRERRRQ